MGLGGETPALGATGLQPGGRPPAPGRLTLVQSFINAHYDLEVEHGSDLFATPASLERWLRRHRLFESSGAAVGEADRRRVIAVRESLRELARDGGASRVRAVEELNEAAAGGAVEIRFSHDGPRFVRAASGVDGALGIVLAWTAAAIIDGSWSRLKICPGRDCGWAFYDHSRNQSGRWCSMSVCGGRAKARAHYRRSRRGAD